MTDRLVLMGVKGGPAIRPGSNMPTSILLQLAGQNMLVDAGLGVTRGICDAGIALTELHRIFVTHLHSDHYLELGPLIHTAWTAGLTRPLPLYGPHGLAEYWQGFQRSMAFDISLRIEDEGRCPFTPLLDLHSLAPGIIHQSPGLVVRAMRNAHPPISESYALRFETPDKTVVLSGDTAHMDEMVEFAQGADLLVHEAMLVPGVHALCDRMPNGDERLRRHILRSHTSAEDVGRIATAAGVRQLALNHFVPDGDPDFPPEAYAAATRLEWYGPLHLGRDGLSIPLSTLRTGLPITAA
ncbi:MAG: MBL fold metallo-hydrolase [Paracoccaceae bacterium]